MVVMEPPLILKQVVADLFTTNWIMTITRRWLPTAVTITAY